MEDDTQGPREPLTAREREVVKLIAEAHTNAQIAEVLHLSEKTVESHRANVLRKLGMRDRVELVRANELGAHAYRHELQTVGVLVLHAWRMRIT